MSVLPDLLRPGLRLVFCGTAPSRKSAQLQAYYAHPGNLFWPTLYQAGFIPEPLQAAEYPRLLDYHIGLTDMNKTQSGVDADLDRAAFDPEGLRVKLERFQPQWLAFTSKNAATAYFGRTRLDYGAQAEPIAATRVWILPSTSGNARPHWPKLRQHWFELAAMLQKTATY